MSYAMKEINEKEYFKKKKNSLVHNLDDTVIRKLRFKFQMSSTMGSASKKRCIFFITNIFFLPQDKTYSYKIKKY